MVTEIIKIMTARKRLRDVAAMRAACGNEEGRSRLYFESKINAKPKQTQKQKKSIAVEVNREF